MRAEMSFTKPIDPGLSRAPASLLRSKPNCSPDPVLSPFLALFLSAPLLSLPHTHTHAHTYTGPPRRAVEPLADYHHVLV